MEPKGGDEVALRAREVLEAQLETPLSAGLYLVATPIGNLADISLRALSVLVRAELIFCEDTRHSRKLLSHFGIKGELKPYHEHNAARERPRILARIRAGFAVALISDAGTPLISDPGFKLAREAAQEGFDVIAIPGASAPIAALVSSGIPSDRFFFEGFLPPKPGARQKRIRALADLKASLILFETAKRIEAVLGDLAAAMGGREAALAKELTKAHETVLRGPLEDLHGQVAAWPEAQRKGEFVIVVGPAPEGQVSEEVIEARLREVLGKASLRDASRLVAAELGVARGRVYTLGLALAGEDET